MKLAGWVFGGGLEKTMTLEQLDWLLQGGSNDKGVEFIYKAVSWAYRCLDLRAKTLASVPWGVYRDGEEVANPYPDLDWYTLLYKTEAARCMWGAAYWLKTRKGPEWISAKTMKPIYKDGGPITGFLQTVGTEQRTFSTKKIVYMPLWNPENDVEHGVAPMEVALNPGNLSNYANEWTAKFFEQGAVPAVILTTEQNIPDTEIERVKSVWQKLYGGIKNAFRTAILRMGLKPTTVGMPISDLMIPELQGEARQQIAASFGVPLAMLRESSNRATLDTQRISFFTETIFTEYALLAGQANEQYWNDKGLEWIPKTAEVEAIQQDETKKALGISRLLDMANKQAESGVLDKEQAQIVVTNLWGQMGIRVGEPEKLEVVTPESNTERTEDLRKWYRKAKKKGACEFNSDVIPEWMNKAIKTRLEVSFETAFDPFLKADIQEKAEKKLAKLLKSVYAVALASIYDTIIAGEIPDLTEMHKAIRSAVEPVYQAAIIDGTLEQEARLGWGSDYADLVAAATSRAIADAEVFIRQTSQTDNKYIAQIKQQYDAGLLTAAAVLAMLTKAFGPIRADMIAATEVTRALQVSSDTLQEILRMAGVKSVQIWETAGDEMVCPVCGALDGTTEDVWRQTAPTGPPIHVRCRCGTRVEITSPRIGWVI